MTVPGRKSPPIHRRPSRSGHLDQADSAEQAHGAPAPPSAYGLVVRLQREVGNKGVTGVLSGQVAPPPLYDPLGAAIAKTANQELISVNERPDEVTLDPVKPVNPANAAVMPPATQAKVLAARATLSRIPKMDSSDLETLKRTTPGAPVLELIKRREVLRDDITYQQSQMSGRMPAARLPDDQMAALDAELAPFQQQVSYDDAEITKTQELIDTIVRGAGAQDEAGLVSTLTKEFPELFVRRAKLIAFQQLSENAEVATNEANRYGLGIPGMGAGANANPADFATKPQDIGGLRRGAHRVLVIDREIAKIQAAQQAANQAARDATVPTSVEGGENSGAGAGSYATTAPELPDLSASNEQLAQLNTERDAIRLQFPILYRPGLDLAALTAASDDEVARATGSEIGKLLANITDTRRSIANDELKVWNLRGIVDLTLQDLGIPPESPLMQVVQRHAATGSDEGLLHKAFVALGVVAGIVATLATGGTALIAAAVSMGISGYEVAKSVTEYGVETAANNVALDPELADISINDPEIMPIMLNLVGLVAGAADLRRAITALRAPAKLLAEGGDLVPFATAARRVLPLEEANRLAAAAGRMAGHDEGVLNTLLAIENTYNHADLKQVTKLLTEHAEVGYAKTFDRMASAGRVHPLNESAVRQYMGEQFVHQVNDPFLRAWYDPTSGRLFVKEGMNAEAFGSWAVHETSHHFQELAVFGSSASFQGEFQAFRMQQQYLHSLEAAAGADAVPASMRWLTNATDEAIAARIDLWYGHQAPAVLEGEAMMQPLLDLLGQFENQTAKVPKVP